jgi:hypothetical protein
LIRYTFKAGRMLPSGSDGMSDRINHHLFSYPRYKCLDPSFEPILTA